MKKLFSIFFLIVAMACGDNSGRSDERGAASEEAVDEGSGEEISPQLELDSSDTRFKVDTLSSAREAEKESDPDDE